MVKIGNVITLKGKKYIIEAINPKSTEYFIPKQPFTKSLIVTDNNNLPFFLGLEPEKVLQVTKRLRGNKLLEKDSSTLIEKNLHELDEVEEEKSLIELISFGNIDNFPFLPENYTPPENLVKVRKDV